MNEMSKLIRLYEEQGYAIRPGLQPWHWGGGDHKTLPLTKLHIYNGTPLDTGLGISYSEMMMFQHLCELIRPRGIYCIGNGFGLSTIWLALLNPFGHISVLDAGIEGADNDLGNKLTLAIAERNGLNVSLMRGRSPEDVWMTGDTDLIFIDGEHTRKALRADMEVCWDKQRGATAMVLHDVLNYDLMPAVDEFRKKHPLWCACTLWGTTTGMVVVSPVGNICSTMRDMWGMSFAAEAATRRELRLLRALGPAIRLAQHLPDGLRRVLRRGFVNMVRQGEDA